eukprot:9479688-Pyramimonas_sp.AAC.1
MDSPALAAAKLAGVVMCKMSQGQGSLVYVPTGWLALEQCEAGQQLNYGIRKSYITKCSEAAETYSS